MGVKILILTAALLTAGSCRQQGVIYPQTACTNNTTMCQNDRPYACGGGVWRPIGDSACGPLGAVCCLDTASQTHTCVAQAQQANRCGGGN
jgi:hypothetical protein